MGKNENKIERLKKVISHFKFENDAAFASEIGVSRSYISEILNRKKDVPKTMGQRLEDTLSVSRAWFDNGEGEMIASKKPEDLTQNNEEVSKLKAEISELKADKKELLLTISDLRDDKKRLLKQLSEEHKKRDQRLEDGGSTISARRN